MNNLKVLTEYNKEDKASTCILNYKGKLFVGFAICHTDDADMASEITGGFIAESRAYIKLYQHIRDHEIKPELKSLKQLFYSMNRSKKFNPKSYENIMLQRQIRLLENELATTKEMIVDAQQNLRAYFTNKEKAYQRIRKYREAKNK